MSEGVRLPIAHAAAPHTAPCCDDASVVLGETSVNAPGDGRGWTDAGWQSNTRRVWAERNMPGSVRAPAIGEVVAL